MNSEVDITLVRRIILLVLGLAIALGLFFLTRGLIHHYRHKNTAKAPSQSQISESKTTKTNTSASNNQSKSPSTSPPSPSPTLTPTPNPSPTTQSITPSDSTVSNPQLTNTGPGNVLGIFMLACLAGTLTHEMYRLIKRNARAY